MLVSEVELSGSLFHPSRTQTDVSCYSSAMAAKGASDLDDDGGGGDLDEEPGEVIESASVHYVGMLRDESSLIPLERKARLGLLSLAVAMFYVHREQDKIGRGAMMTYPTHMTFQVLLCSIRILPTAVIELLYTVVTMTCSCRILALKRRLDHSTPPLWMTGGHAL